MKLSFRTLGLFLDSSGLGFEGRYLASYRFQNGWKMRFGPVLVLGLLENACWILCYFLKAEISGLGPDFWPGMTSLCGLFLVCYCWKLNNMLNVLKIC